MTKKEYKKLLKMLSKRLKKNADDYAGYLENTGYEKGKVKTLKLGTKDVVFDIRICE